MLTWTLTLGLLACGNSDNAFGSSGSRFTSTDDDTTTTEETEETDTDTETEEDTGDAYGDWPQPQDANGPSLGTLTAWFDEFGNIGDVIYVEVAYFDPQDDLMDGRFKVWIESENGDVNGNATGDIKDTTGSSADAWIEDGSFFFVISIQDEWQYYFLKVRAWDQANNQSNDLEGSVGPD